MSRLPLAKSTKACTDLARRVKELESFRDVTLLFKKPGIVINGLAIGMLYYMYEEYFPVIISQQKMKEEIRQLNRDRDQLERLFNQSARTMSFKSEAYESQMMRMIREMEEKRKERRNYIFSF
ncbi:hypothetical protein PG984_015720 [Apiospora sp. TS-2023a]